MSAICDLPSEWRLVGETLNRDHRELIWLCELTRPHADVVAALAAHQLRPRSFRLVSRADVHAALRAADISPVEVSAFLRGCSGRNLLTSWPVLAVQVLCLPQERHAASAAALGSLVDRLSRTGGHVVREERVRAAHRRAAALKPDRCRADRSDGRARGPP